MVFSFFEDETTIKEKEEQEISKSNSIFPSTTASTSITVPTNPATTPGSTLFTTALLPYRNIPALKLWDVETVHQIVGQAKLFCRDKYANNIDVLYCFNSYNIIIFIDLYMN
jgi:ethanolamine utilization protein EutA (predicted chaperonin)